MSFYPSNTNTTGKGNPLLRAVGALLALASMLGAALGIFFRPDVPSLIFASIVALFGLRVFMLWLKAQPTNSLPAAPVVPGRPVAVSTYPSVQPPLSIGLEQQPVIQAK